MIRTVVAKELLLLIRGLTFRIVLIGYLMAFGLGYLLSYSEFAALEGTIPTEARHIFGKRIFMNQAILLTILTPWVVSHAMRSPRRDAMITAIALMALPPWKMICGKFLATGIYLYQLVCLSLPAMLLTALLGAANRHDIVGSYITLLVWLTLVQLSTLWWHLFVVAALPALILSYMTLLLLSTGYWYLGGLIDEIPRLVTMAGINLCLGLLMLRYGNRALLYLKE